MIIEIILGYLFSLYKFIKRKIMGKNIADNKIKVGIITKAYPKMDAYEVKFRNKNKKVIAKMLHNTFSENTGLIFLKERNIPLRNIIKNT